MRSAPANNFGDNPDSTKAIANPGPPGRQHKVACRHCHGIRYMNCGDWVESCTALAEHEDGTFEIIIWADPERSIAPVPQVAARAA